MTTESDTRPAVRLCCGKPGAWLPGKDKPQVPACILCPSSGRHWNGKTEDQAAADRG